ncbi:MAG: hemerythrin domain-containing protein [Gammaproteobacteria bacterium]|nr:hemerythrin domain-containing protein [Gammaproteobacteria bacterium]MBU1415647.1 hemerythrin domain-containing protein [Gammaproteobacteria bacterium]
MQATEVLPDHHRTCDDIFVDAEKSAMAGRWQECAQTYGHFRREIAAHFSTEEQVLFPAFEAASGSSMGPTQMMRLEHAQMNTLMHMLDTTIAACDRDGFAGAAETLLIMMQQHNMKEENILYPMCDRALAGRSLPLREELANRAAPCPT